MAEPFARVDRITFAHIGQIFLRRLAGPGARRGAEPLAELVACRIHRLALGHRRRFDKIAIEIDGADAGSDALPVAQSWPRLSTSIDSTPSLSAAADVGDLAVIDRLDEAGLDQPALEKGAAPSPDRQMHHIGHHVDARDQTAAEAEPLATVSSCILFSESFAVL